MDYFERLGLPRRFSVDPTAVEREYLARSRAAHPDFHQLGTAAEQRASLEASAGLNEAYLALKDPFRRAEYLLGLLGGPTAQAEKNLDPSFLMEMMDYRERIEETRAAGGSAGELDAAIAARLAGVLADVGRRFASLEATAAPELTAIRRQLNAAKTLQSLLRDLRSD